MSPRPPRTLVVWCPDWPVSATGRPAEQAIAVVAGQRIIAASTAAREKGVVPGQRRRQAQACCPELTVLAHDAGGEIRAFEPVVRALEAFGAPVALRRPGWAALGTRGPARYFGGEAALTRAVAAAVADALPALARAPAGDPAPLAGPWWRVGIADGPFAATMAAQRGVVVPAGRTASFLAPFGVEALGRPELAELLRRLGISTLGGLASLDEADVLARFGPDGARAQRLAKGLDERPFRGRPPVPDLAVATELDPPADRVDAVTFVSRGLAEALGGRLAERGLACTLLEVEVETGDGGRLSRLWGNDGVWTPGLVAERLRWQLEAWLTGRPPDGPPDDPGGLRPRAPEEWAEVGIAAVRLVAVEVVADRGRQLELWGRSHAADERVARVLARVQGMLGHDGAVRPVLVGGRGPAERVRLVPFGDPVPDGVVGADLPWPGRLPSPSPAVVPADPPRARVLDAGGAEVAVDGRGAPSAPPASIATSGGEPVTVVAWAGPWPVDERWWDGTGHRRRARLQVVTATGEAYLVALERGTWLVEGRYD